MSVICFMLRFIFVVQGTVTLTNSSGVSNKLMVRDASLSFTNSHVQYVIVLIKTASTSLLCSSGGINFVGLST